MHAEKATRLKSWHMLKRDLSDIGLERVPET